MLLNYLSVAWRSLRKNALYSLINIGGLSAGLCVCMLILLYVIHEHSYDRFHKNADRIFRVHGSLTMGGSPILFQGLSYPSGPLVKQVDPRVDSYVRMKIPDQPVPVQNKGIPDRLFAEKKWAFADRNFFSFFSFPLIRGTPQSVLQKPFTVVLSERAAKKYFGEEDPVGKLLLYNHTYTMEITGVAKNPPSNSSIDFDFIASLSSIASITEMEHLLTISYAGPGEIFTYVRLTRPGAAQGVEKTMNMLASRGEDPGFSNPEFHLDAFRDTHLGLNFGDWSNIKYLTLFPLIAALVLLLALINYMSLATARATTRAKEIGVRKTMGAGRKTVAFQFYVESGLYAVLAFALSFVLFTLLRPGFLNLLHLSIDTSFLMTPTVLGLFAGLLVITILLAGSYPAIVLSSFSPVSILSGKGSKQRGGALVRKSFTVLQFTISVALIVCSIIMNQQLYFFRHKDTGLNRGNMVMIPFSRDMGKHYSAFKQDVAVIPGVGQMATTHFPLYGSFDMSFVDGINQGNPFPLWIITADAAFIPTVGIHWKFPPADLAELNSSENIVLNESAIPALHLSPNPVGQTISMNDSKYKVAGVVKDFNYENLGTKINPIAIVKDTSIEKNLANPGCLYVKIPPHVNLPTLLESIRKVHDRYDPGTPFEYQFMDDAFNDLFKSEDRLADLLEVFTVLTIGIACLGLFALAAFSAAQRTKEIGIRKVLGAGVLGIVRLLTTEFIILVGISIVMATPLAWWAMNHWLRDFAYRISINPWVFAGAGLGALVIALITVSAQALRAAWANPVKSLRSE